MARSQKRLKSLESDLQELHSFDKPNLLLEQYHTPPSIAATALHIIELNYDDIKGKFILDLGCGCGILGLGCIRLGAKRVVGVDIDQNALDIALENAVDVGLSSEQVTFLKYDVRQLTKEFIPDGMAIDTVITNPPFGTKQQAGIDYVFVQKGLELANVVYSLHKSSTRKFWEEAGELGASVELVEKDLSFTIERTFKFHKKDVHEISVDLIRFSK